MTLSEISVRRPVLATVMSLALVLLGLVSYQRLTTREYPKIDEPTVTITTTYTGASPNVIESQVTQPLEDGVSGIEGIDVMTSSSRSERSQITLTFRMDRDIDSAANDVRDRVSRARRKLPDEVDDPVIAKTEADADPIVYLALAADRHSPLEISDAADRVVKDRLQNLMGVSDIGIFGERRFAMRIWLDPERLAAYAVTAQSVEDALRKQNIELPAGRVESRSTEFTVLSRTSLQTPGEFENIVLRDDGGYLVRLRDVGRAELAAADDRTTARFKGETGVSIGVIKQSTANPLDVSRAVRDALPGIRENLPPGMSIAVAYDTSVFIDRSIKSVFHTIGEAIALVMAVIFLFLRNARATLIPLVTIPVALIGAFALMYAFNFSINTLTLLAMVLAIGLVVDDSIVMMENIFRHIEGGMTPLRAALVGSREIGFAIVAMTVTLAAVYAPIGFMSGRTGRLFTEFALTLAGAVIVSGFVALTLSPMMCSKLLRHQARHSFLFNLGERALNGIVTGYRALLRLSLRARPAVLLIGIGAGVAGWFLLGQVKQELAPVEDRGTVSINFSAPEGSTLDFTDRYIRRVEPDLPNIPGVDSVFVVVGRPDVTRGNAILRLRDWDERAEKQWDIARAVSPRLRDLAGVSAFAVNPPSLGQRFGSRPVNLVVQTSRSFDELQVMVDALIRDASRDPRLGNVDSDLRLNKPELRVTIDREKAADLGVDVDVIGKTLQTMLGGRQVTRFERDGKQYDVLVQVADINRAVPDDIARIHVKSRSGQMIALSNLVRLEEGVAPRELNHFNKLRAATVSATLENGGSLGEALTVMEEAARRTLPQGTQIDYAGTSREFKVSASGLYTTFILALFFIYLVLAAQFESFVDPFVIMLTVPLSMTGALLALNLSGATLNVYSQIGLVTLIGLITKHGILIVEFANQLQRAGHDARRAVEEATVLRLRPILMTTGAMVLGAVPLAVASGAGAESRQAIGAVIVGGMLLGTLLTLFVVPTVYSLIARKTPIADAAPVEVPAVAG